MTKERQPDRQRLPAKANDKYFNYSKKRYHAKDCHSTSKKKLEKLDKIVEEVTKQTQWYKRQFQRAAAVCFWLQSQAHNNSDPEPYPAS